MTLYAVEGLSVTIGARTLVDGVGFAIDPGECVALAGESGSGKTLSALTPFGLSAGVAHGSARLDGIELVGAPERILRGLRRSRIGFVFQQPLTALTPHMTAARHLTEATMQAGAPRPSRADLAERLAAMEIADPADKLDRYPHQLSGGERQRLMIACAIAHDPALLVADEPTAALDAHLRRGVMELIDRLRRERGMGVLLVSHDLSALARHADRALVLKDGALVEHGPARTLFAAPSSDYARALVAAVPVIGAGPASPPVAEALLEVAGLAVRYGRTETVHDITFTIAKGEAVALIGGSGSGKSTIGRAVAGLGPMSAGRIAIAGRALTPQRSREERRRIQTVFQDPHASLDPRWRVSRIIAEPLVHLRPDLDERARAGLVEQAMHDVGLAIDLADHHAAALSGGQAQRVAIARALVADPDLLVLDEPTSALDPLVAARIIDLLADLRDRRGLAMLFITHDLAIATRLCHRALVMDAGRVVEAGDMGDLVATPTTPLAKALVAATGDVTVAPTAG